MFDAKGYLTDYYVKRNMIYIDLISTYNKDVIQYLTKDV